MNSRAEVRLRLVNERHALDQRYAARTRLAEQARRRHRLSLRSRAGHALIAAGHRLATEPHLTPVRSR